MRSQQSSRSLSFSVNVQGDTHGEDLAEAPKLREWLLVDEQKWDEQVEAQRVTEGGAVAYCVNPTVHPETHCDTVPSMAVHKETCLKPGKN